MSAKVTTTGRWVEEPPVQWPPTSTGTRVLLTNKNKITLNINYTALEMQMLAWILLDGEERGHRED